MPISTWVASSDLREIVDGLDDEALDRLADDVGVAVEGGEDAEALRREAAVLQDCAAELADADEHHGPFAVDAEDLAQLFEEALDAVAAALLAEAAEVAEVLADLGGRDAEGGAQLL